MSLDDFNDFVAYSRLHFEEGLIRAGFVEHESGWRGHVTHPEGSTKVEIILPATFPFEPPRVLPVENDEVPWSWHRELDGALCLVAEDDHDALWWVEAQTFLEHVAAWFESSDAGWVDDRPDVDLDRYFDPSGDTRLYLYGELHDYCNTFVKFVRASNNTMRLINKGIRPVRPSKHLKDKFGYIADLGEILSPPRDWAGISALLDSTINLERRVREHSIDLLVLRYTHGGSQSAIVLEVWPTTTRGVGVRRLRSGADTVAARSVRSGPRATELSSSRVAVVGVGALGSFVADMLVRSGVGKLTLVDSDVVMPGNLIRHLVGPEAVGLPKANAVSNYLVQRHRVDQASIEARVETVSGGDTAVDLLRSHDLVVNATADFAVTALFHKAAEAIATRFLSVALQNDGDTYRIDVLPPFDEAVALPNSANSNELLTTPLFESGCGSPISPAPPHAVIEAAAATVRHVVGLLLHQPIHPSGEVRHLISERVEER